mmetsp:Transcript_40434/g.79130  ORF Transcript_40434/g.79130 Transcript_40434/m.79130 type:complete len:422 (-) Transcript_40434:88-1353(-)|eukprot:CAMPEP_0194334294 /NCGR_PEP_ID=MMETSP0171-20130528/65624_1 /TAXON_ID=218684 /ORGANISM="Corethron pennatum, Strain L29A3" /LENGTH=421 /DNA_ID=CAMNT_0039096877 /DNA_START=115 /DNA_END=1380 /DNA_ORIENTATION=-
MRKAADSKSKMEGATEVSEEEGRPLISSIQGSGPSKKNMAEIDSGGKAAEKADESYRPKDLAALPAPRSQTNSFIKYGSLVLLCFQMVGLVLLMRYSRVKKVTDGGDGGGLYLASTAVFIMEAIKFAICMSVIFHQCHYSPSAFAKAMDDAILKSPLEILKLSVPSLTYTIQNNLLYCALTNLDAATYQVMYQLKILTTAVFSAVLLQRQFSARKWMSLVTLTVGVALAQTSGSGDGGSHHHPAHAGGGGDAAELVAAQNRIVGTVAVLCAACTSGFSGVYFERILKGSPRVTLWVRNIQMGLPSIVIAFLSIYIKDGAAVASKGFFQGYNPIVWTVVSVQAAGGLIVAVVVKYADNVLKVFAASFSIVVTGIISVFLFDFKPDARFCLGTLFVVSAIVIYSSPEKAPKKTSILPVTARSQ